METLPTQDVCDGYFSDEEESSQESVAWGRLFPLGESFVALGKFMSVRSHQIKIVPD